MTHPDIITTIPEESRESSLYIIIAKGADKFKIGRSVCPERRIKELQTGNPYKLEFLLILENQGPIEKLLHNRLRRYRSRYEKGEWFNIEGIGMLPDWIYEQLDLELLL